MSKYNNHPRYNGGKIRYTESILNSTKWLDGNGEVTDVSMFDEQRLHNIMNSIYANRARYWLNCKNIHVIEQYRNGDEFFGKVIRKSTLWRGIIHAFEIPSEGFNFVTADQFENGAGGNGF